ncbi:MAG: HAMP domain-containing protein, partial [Gammaproteobacteria bacterium]|nr:HAMP domain-containing protein [Gammaproteobacteria bacterium]
MRNSISEVEKTIYAPIEKLQQTTKLQKLLHLVKGPVQAYSGRREQAHQVTFENLHTEIQLTIKEGTELGNLVPRELELLKFASVQWNKTHDSGLNLLASGRENSPLDRQSLAEFQLGLDKTLFILDQLETTIVSGIQNQRLSAQKLQWEGITFSLMVFGGCFLFAIVGAWVMYQSVFAPIRKLERSVNKFGQGDLTSRASLQTNDELGHLASAFNAMAERFQKVQSELDYLAVHDALTSLYDRTKLREIVELE